MTNIDQLGPTMYRHVSSTSQLSELRNVVSIFDHGWGMLAVHANDYGMVGACWRYISSKVQRDLVSIAATVGTVSSHGDACRMADVVFPFPCPAVESSQGVTHHDSP